MTVFGRTSLYANNRASATAPTINDDSTRGFTAGAEWFDTRTSITWVCIDATAGAAIWTPQMASQCLATLIGANMNITTDQPFLAKYPLTASGLKWTPTRILCTNASVSLTTAAGGIYDTAAKGGNAIVAAAQVYTALTTALKVLALTIAAAGSSNLFNVVPILSLTTGQGGAGTADFYLIGDIIANG